MFELLVIAIFIWLLVKSIGLAFKLTWGCRKDRCQYPDRSGIPGADRLLRLYRRYRTDGPCGYDCNCSRHPEGLLLNTLP